MKDLARKVELSINSIMFDGDGDLLQLKNLWEKNYEDLKLLQERPELFEPIERTKEYFKILIRERGLYGYMKARLRFASRQVYMRAWKQLRVQMEAEGRKEILERVLQIIYNYSKEEEVIMAIKVTYEIDFCKPEGFQLIELSNGCERVLGTFPAMVDAEREMEAYVTAGKLLPSIENSLT